MHREKMNHYKQRVNFFFDLLQRDYLKQKTSMQAEGFVTDEPVPFSDISQYEMKPVNAGDVWGNNWQCAWMRVTGQIPAEWRGEKVVARISVGGEALIFNHDGLPLQGLTDGSVFWTSFVRDIFPVVDQAEGGENIDLLIDCAANKIVGLELDTHPRLDTDNPYGRAAGKLAYMDLVVFDEDVWQLMLDYQVGLSLMNTYKDDDYRFRQLLLILSDAIDLYCGSPENASKVRAFLKEKLFSAKANSSALNVTSVGHAHIDTAWLWPMRETIRKCGRTFANQIALIERYPGYVFGASQPQHYQFTKDHYPSLYEKIKKAVADGSWELQGGMWVEADCNVISGESMVRQFIHGKNFYMDEFGVDVKNLWIPDVFGYSAAMPQIIKGSGCNYFLTQKISWNQYNKFPHHTFMWRGIDGTSVLTHFPPENTYNARCIPEELCPAQNRFNEAEKVDEFMSLYGLGDGGGGPRDDYVERLMRMKDLEGCPKAEFGHAADFFERINRFADKLDVWEGELYLEEHQGTLTTQARVKKMNRKLEYMLKHVEFVYSCLPLPEYPVAELDRLWKTLLVNQFHDIIPGSSITRVYKETNATYDEMWATCQELLAAAAAKLLKQDDACMTLFNSLGCEYRGPIALPEGWSSATVDGECLACQNEDGKVMAEVCIPAYGFITLEKAECVAEAVSGCNDLVLENDYVRYEFNQDAQLVSVYDKEVDYELIKDGATANVLSIYHDDPVRFDAWNIDITYENQHLEDARGIRAVKTVDGPLRQILEFDLKISNSTIKQKVILGHGRRLDFVTEVEWDESHRMLRTKFPVDIHTTDAVFDIQYGYIKRFSARNTSWDLARYEVPAHRYADLSDSQYGVALLNDCKYGHKVFERTLDLTLLRSPKYPDFNADMGSHQFTYSLLPHTESLLDSNVINNAAILNQPPLRFEGFKAGDAVLPCSLDAEDISLEVCKKAEKEECLVIRLVETKGRRSSGTLKFNKPIERLVRTNMIEWEDNGTVELDNLTAKVELKPFEIVTFKVY